MKLIVLFILVLTFLKTVAQQEEFQMQGQIVDSNKKPVTDVYIYNTRSLVRVASRVNGIFDMTLLPKDSLIITHISYIRKTVTAYDLMVNPVIQLELDTVSIRQVNISGSQKTEYDNAMKNLERIDFDFRPHPTDNFTEEEQMKELMKTEDRVQRVSASSITLYSFSPSQVISKWSEKRKKRKEAKQYSSTKELEPLPEK